MQTKDEHKPGWTARFYQTAVKAGYVFSYGHIGSAVKPLIEQFGVAAVEPVWEYWLENAVDLGSAKYMSPSNFARTFGYWRGMAKPLP